MFTRNSALPLLFLALSTGPALLPAQDEGIPWFDNYKAALQEARRTRKPIFLEFRCEA
ncbi:MAG: hypothetical protein IT167_24865 [Bryobacterales bacterium]|nr:hypothetical protein [Bryobacterales bacterium]